MSRPVLFAAAGVLVLAVVLLVVKLRGEREPAGKTTRPAARATAGDRPQVRERKQGPPRLVERPSIDTPAPDRARAATPAGDEIVRDHRSGLKSSGKPKVRLAPKRVSSLHKTLRPAVRECAKNHPPTMTGARSRVTMELSIDITGERLSVHEAKVAAQGAEDAEALLECVRQKAAALEVEATGQQDITGYKLSMGFVLRR